MQAGIKEGGRSKWVGVRGVRGTLKNGGGCVVGEEGGGVFKGKRTFRSSRKGGSFM